MATVREYFDTDMKTAGANATWTLKSVDATFSTEVIAKIAYDFAANAKYWYFYIPEVPDPAACIQAILACPETANCMLASDGDGVSMWVGFADYSERQDSSTLVFTGRVNLYIDVDLTEPVRRAFNDLFRARGLQLAIWDAEWARKRSSLEKPLAFISHDSRDKDTLVRELAAEMSKAMCPVWYDEYSLKVGDSLRTSIEQGLRETSHCVVVLSPAFLANKGWGQAEFDSVFTREILEKKGVMLPVWHNVTAQDVYQYSPRLADKVGLPSSLGAAELARRLVAAIKAGD